MRSSHIFYIFALCVEIVTIFEPKVVAISARTRIIWKICKLCKAIFSTHYNIFHPNFGILDDQKIVYNANCPLQDHEIQKHVKKFFQVVRSDFLPPKLTVKPRRQPQLKSPPPQATKGPARAQLSTVLISRATDWSPEGVSLSPARC